MDIAPALLEKVQKEFNRLLSGNKEIKKYNELIKDGEATYEEMNEYAVLIGEMLAAAYREITEEDLPNGKMYFNIADRVVRPTLEEAHTILADRTAEMQKGLNTKAGLGFNAARARLNQSRIRGIVDRLTEAENFDTISRILKEPVINYAQSVVDETLKLNVEFQAKAGVYADVIRRYDPVPITTYIKRGKNGKIYGPYQQTNPMPCKFCLERAGVYEYGEVGGQREEVYRRHENCRCKITYYPGKGSYVQDVWSKSWQELNEDKIQERIKQVQTVLEAQ